jgi:anti-sigma-K factor RskA
MTEDPHANGGDDHAENLAELALGILTGRERAAALAHVDSCQRCAEELEQLSHAADAVVRVAPEIEPPMGFEVRLFNRMGLTEPPAPLESTGLAQRRATARWGSRLPRWVLASAAAVIALALGLGIGWSTGTSPNGGPHDGPAGAEVAVGNLTANGSSVGSVNTYGGSKPWMIVTLADSWSDGKVTCEVITKDGVTHEVGSFTAKDGYGAWGAPLRVAPQDVQKAEVVSSTGKVIATAALRGVS